MNKLLQWLDNPQAVAYMVMIIGSIGLAFIAGQHQGQKEIQEAGNVGTRASAAAYDDAAHANAATNNIALNK